MISSHDGGRSRLAGEMRSQIIAHELAHCLPGLDRTRSVMRLQHHIVELEKPRIDARLVEKDIETSGLDRSTLKRGNERIFVNGRTT